MNKPKIRPLDSIASAINNLKGVGYTQSNSAFSISFSINGRFYGQPITGVQRYAREIVREIDNLLHIRGDRANLILPSGAVVSPNLAAITSVKMPIASGHLWEQAILPICTQRPLLNLGNTAPLSIHSQIVCIHDANVFDAPSSYSWSFQFVYRHMLPKLTRRAKIITSVSQGSAQRLSYHLGIPLKNIFILPNGHEHVFRWDAGESALGLRLSAIRPFVLLLGSLAKHKNASFILDQASALDELGIDIVVAGGTAQIFTQTYKYDAENIHYVGFVTDNDLAWLYTNALCLAFPSFYEGFGIPLVEAMALGCPIVSSNSSCMPEIYGDAALSAGPQNTEVWIAHFQRLASSASLRNDLRGRGREQVRRFSWNASAQAYMDLLNSF